VRRPHERLPGCLRISRATCGGPPHTGARRALPQPAPDGVDLLVPRTDEDFAGLIAAQREAFGEDEPVTDAAVERLRRTVADGALAVLARDTPTPSRPS